MTLINAIFLSFLPFASLANPGPLSGQARFVPELESGHLAGYRCSDLRAGSAYAALGLRNGDVVLRVDGESLDNPATAFEKLGRLGQRPKGKVVIALRRDGSVIHISSVSDGLLKTIDGNGPRERAPAMKQVKR